MVQSRRIAIVGAGPIGLEAALFAKRSGYEVDVFERGETCRNVQSWGHVRLFSPFGLNASPWGQDALKREGRDLPDEEELLTGREFAERYLIPLSKLPELAGCIREQAEVRAIGRDAQIKQDNIGHPARSQTPFLLLVMQDNREKIARADYVLDCSGTYPHHNWLGSGGIACPGELQFLKDENYQLPDILGRDKSRFENRSVLVGGGGYSAATAIVALAELAKIAPRTKAVWLTRKESEWPIPPIANDALPERKRLTAQANGLAVDSLSPIEWRQGRVAHSIHRRTDQRLHVTLHDQQGRVEKVMADEILALVGYRPDRSLYEELQVHECYASQGPMKLAAALLGETSADCLAQSSPGGETLKNPEPGFFIFGAKSYGRNSRFLLKIGHDQIREVFSLMKRDHERHERHEKV